MRRVQYWTIARPSSLFVIKASYVYVSDGSEKVMLHRYREIHSAAVGVIGQEPGVP